MARTKKAACRVLRGSADSGSHGLGPLGPYPPPPVPSPTHAIPAANDSQQAAQPVETWPSAEGWNNVLSTALAPLHRCPGVASPPLTSPTLAVDDAPPLALPVSFSTDAFISPFASLLPQAPQRDLCDRCNAAVMPVASTPTSGGPTNTSACFCICCRRSVPVVGFGVDDRSERRILRRCSACASAAPDALHDITSKLPIQLQHAGAIDRAHAAVWKEVMKFEDHIRAQPHVPSLVAADALLLKLADLAVQHKKERHDVLQRAVALLVKGGSSSQQRVSLFNEWLGIEIERVSVWSRKAERCCTLLAGRGIAVSSAAQELMKAAGLTVAVPSMPNGAVVCEGCSSVLALPLPSTSPHGDACHCCQRRLPTSAMVQIRSGGRLCTSCHSRCQDHSRVARMAHGRLDLEQLEPITEFVRSLLARVREAMSGDTQQLDELCAPHLNVWDALERRGKVLSRNQQRKFASGHTPVVSSRQLYADFEDMARNWRKTLREIVHIAATRELRFAIQLTPDEHKLLDELFTDAVRPVFHNVVTTTALAPPPIKAPASGSKGDTLKDKSAACNLLATPSSTGILCEGCKALLYVVPQLSETTQDHQRFVVSCHCCCRRLPMAVMVRHESGSVMCTSCVTGSNGSATLHLGFDHLNAIISRVQKLVAAVRGLSDTDVEPFKRECAVQLSKITQLSARWKNIRKRHRREFLQGEKTVDMCRQMYTEASNCEQAVINAVRVLARLAADRADVMPGLPPLNKRARSQLLELFRGVDMPLSVSKLVEGVELASKPSPKQTAPPPPPKLPASSVRKRIVPELISSATTPVPPSLDPKDCCGQCAAVLETTGHPSGSSFGFCDCCERVLPSDVTAKVDVEREIWACAACRSRHNKLPDWLSTLRSPQRVTFERMETVHRVSTSLRTVIQESYQDAMWSKDQVDHVVMLIREADKWVQRRSDLEREHLQQIQKGKTPLWTSKKMYDDAVIVGSAYEQAHVTLIKALAAACRERRIRVPVNLTDILSASKRSEATVPEAVVVVTPRAGDSRAAKTTATTTVVSNRQQVQASRPHQDSMARKPHTAKSAVSTSIPTATFHDQQVPSHHTAATPHRNHTQLGPPITTNQQPPIHSVGGASQTKHTQRGPLGAPKHAMVPAKLPNQRGPTHHAAATLHSNHPQGGPPVVASKVNQPHPPIHYAGGASQTNHTQRGSLGTPKLATAPIKNHTIVPIKSARPTSSSTNHSTGRYVSVISNTVEPIVKPTEPLTSQQGAHDSPQKSHEISSEKAPETPRGESQQHHSGDKRRRSRSSDMQEKADSEPHSKSRSRARSSTRSTRRSRSRSRSSSRRRRQSRSRSRSRSKSRKTRSRDRYRSRRRSRSSSRSSFSSSSSSRSRSPSRSRSRDKRRLRDSRKRRRSRSRDRSRSKRRSRSRSSSRSSSRSRSRSRSRRDDQRSSSRRKSSKKHSPSSRADRRRRSRSRSRSRSRDRRS
jgi:hypothetical protein